MQTFQIRWRLLAVILLLVSLVVAPQASLAQTKEPEKSVQPVREQAIPLAVVCAAGFER